MSSFKGQPAKTSGGIPMILDLSRDMVIQAVNSIRLNEGLMPIPKNAEVGVHVPGGGDYSNCDIDVGTAESPISIRWRE